MVCRRMVLHRHKMVYILYRFDSTVRSWCVFITLFKNTLVHQADILCSPTFCLLSKMSGWGWDEKGSL